MGKLHSVGKITIRVYGNDHPPAHCHVTGPDGEAVISLELLTVTEGELPRSAREQIMTWLAGNRDIVAEEWNRLNPRFPTAFQDRT